MSLIAGVSLFSCLTFASESYNLTPTSEAIRLNQDPHFSVQLSRASTRSSNKCFFSFLANNNQKEQNTKDTPACSLESKKNLCREVKRLEIPCTSDEAKAIHWELPYYDMKPDMIKAAPHFMSNIPTVVPEDIRDKIGKLNYFGQRTRRQFREPLTPEDEIKPILSYSIGIQDWNSDEDSCGRMMFYFGQENAESSEVQVLEILDCFKTFAEVGEHNQKFSWSGGRDNHIEINEITYPEYTDTAEIRLTNGNTAITLKSEAEEIERRLRHHPRATSLN